MGSLLEQPHRATVQGVTCGNVLFVVDIIVPVLTSYLSHWMCSSQVCVRVCVWKKEYTQVHTRVGEIVSAVPTIDSKRNAQI